jgi:hypothetical protein
MAFRVGQEIICIDDSYHSGWRYVPNKPVAGQIYIVREIVIGWWQNDEDVGLRLEEIINEPIDWRGGHSEACFGTWRFRPLTETKSKTSFTEGAPLDSERFDNRRKQRETAQ